MAPVGGLAHVYEIIELYGFYEIGWKLNSSRSRQIQFIRWFSLSSFRQMRAVWSFRPSRFGRFLVRLN